MRMNRRLAYAVCLIVACDKKATDPSKHETEVSDTVVAASPACTAKVKELEPWLAKLAVETKSHEVDFGYKLQVIDREPMPVEKHVDDVEMTKTSIGAWDVSQGNHVDSKLPDHATQAQLTGFLTRMHDQKATADVFEPESDDLLRVDVDRETPWGDVTHVIDAATKAGYQRVVFAFTATSKLARPPGVEDTTKSADAEQAASDQLEALGKTCKPLHRVSMPHHHGQVVADAAAYAKETAAALLACGCVPDPDELRKLAWIDARWHQAVPRVGVVLELAGTAATTITQPAKTPWSEAYAQVLAATGPIKLAAK
jgi:hypothetical protein